MVNQDNRTQGIVTQDDGLLAGESVASTSEMATARDAGTLADYAGFAPGTPRREAIDRLMTSGDTAGAFARADGGLTVRSQKLVGPDVAPSDGPHGPDGHQMGQNPPQIHSLEDAVTRLARSGTGFVNSGVRVVRDVKDVAAWLQGEVLDGAASDQEPTRSSVPVGAAGRGKVILA